VSATAAATAGASDAQWSSSQQHIHIAQLDGVAVTPAEVQLALEAFGYFHKAKYVLDDAAAADSSAPKAVGVSSRWMQLLYESSIATAGGLAVLGTAANPLHPVNWSQPAPSAAALPLPPCRPVVSLPASRKHARKLADDLLAGALASAQQQRAFDAAWEEAVHAPGGVVDTMLQQERDGTYHAENGDAGAGAAGSLPSNASTAASAAAQQQRLIQDKVRTMRLFLQTANPSVLLAHNAAAAQLRRKQRAEKTAAAPSNGSNLQYG